ncbi:hypothetical protein [Paenibacillus woosongensis]|uniref:Uncharacterized protein n=1 Tax=Paenibacillus woosongensis TaxID=307580 RepID=A0ABQ4MPU0_9BACL|nr:hypothetical protein [Paenibacillus woosongensis]GIP58007.1 hypothetical protein J15TS10_18210 [Paenibacillus woosongensis]
MSKKLSGNGLWESSRMMLPQHKEQSVSASRQAAGEAAAGGAAHRTVSPPTAKDIEVIKSYIILPVALEIVEKKNREVEMSSQTFKALYAAATKVLAQHIRGDIQRYRKSLLEQGIRIFEPSMDGLDIRYRFVCRGMEDEFTMTRDYLKSQVSLAIGHYTNHLTAILRGTGKR